MTRHFRGDRDPSSRTMVRLPVVRRKCLRCTNPFDGDKVTFICGTCKHSNDWTDRVTVDAPPSNARESGNG